jgi:hypothetical protein
MIFVLLAICCIVVGLVFGNVEFPENFEVFSENRYDF